MVAVDPGLDLAELHRSGLSTPYLWDAYGPLRDDAANTAERRAYVYAAAVALSMLRAIGCKSRNGTHFRIASAILLEMSSAPACTVCRGTGRIDLVANVGPICPMCAGSGLRRNSMSWRASECECHRNDFRDRLHNAYQATLAYLANLRRQAAP